MIPTKEWSGKTVAVLGLARSGLAGVESLVAGDVNVLAWDNKESLRHEAEAAGATIQDLDTVDWSQVDGFFLSPGIPHLPDQASPTVLKALEAEVPIISDIDLLYNSQSDQKFIGITGTNGKSTTTALVGHLLTTAKIPNQTGGNIGRAALDLDILPQEGVYVLELSSYQLERMEIAQFDSALLLNIKPDHLERHGNMEGYVKAKARLFERVKLSKIISQDDEHSCQVLAQNPGATPVSCNSKTQMRIEGGILMDGETAIIDLKKTPSLFAEHNWQNALGAYAVTKFLGISQEDYVKGFQTFPGLEHRQERVLEKDNILYINDSKATNVDSALQALKAYENIYWIVGGRAKQDDYQECLKYAPHIKHVYAIGEARKTISEALSGTLKVTSLETLDQALIQARKDVNGASNAVVLLSPACASFDQFKDFEARGEHFKHLVREMV